MRAFALLAPALIAGCAPAIVEAPPPAAPAAASSGTVVAPAGNPAIGGVVLPADRPIADTLAAAPALSILVRALAAGGMTENLRAAGPFTLFAPSDAAWGRMQPGTVEALLKPDNRAALARLLALHLVAERLTGLELMSRVTAGGGGARLATVGGEALTVTMTGGILTLTDAGGNRSYVEVADVRQVNGVVHVVNGVLVPRLN